MFALGGHSLMGPSWGEANKETVRRFLESLGSAGAVAPGGALHDDVCWRTSCQSVSAQGRESVEDSLRALTAGYVRPTTQVCDLVCEGDTVVARWRIRDAADPASAPQDAMTFFMFEQGQIIDAWSVLAMPRMPES